MATRKEQQAVRSEVDEVLKRRARALRARQRALAAVPAAAMAELEVARVDTPHMALAASAAGTRGWVIAEGDSWFDYPGEDILDHLHTMGYSIESVARAGDRAEMMAFGRGQLDKFAAAVDKVIATRQQIAAVLLSGGGNDIAGAEFGFLINHAGSPTAGLNDNIVTGVIDERVRNAYLHILQKVRTLCQSMLGFVPTIVLHGYGYPVPDGKGVLGGWGPLPGPWLRPRFIEKGFDDLAQNTLTVKKLIDRFNVMVKGVADSFGDGKVKYVDLRPLLPAEKRLWANELHPKEPGFRAAAEAIAGAF